MDRSNRGTTSNIDDNVTVYFVLPADCSKDEAPVELKKAYHSLNEHECKLCWTTEQDCLKMSPVKTDVFVLESFDGPAFKHLSQSSGIVVGPRCVVTCIIENVSVPNKLGPTFTLAMRDLIITVSGGGPQRKKRLRERIEWMAGIYTPNLSPQVTHLVVDTVQSTKYEKALELGIHVMTVDWIEVVWQASIKENVRATDTRFQRYKCPTFFGLRICTTQVPAKIHKELKDLVSKNGGSLESTLTADMSILVVGRAGGEKYKHAKIWNIPCVSVQWVYDCVERDQALKTKEYEVRSTGSSTPIREEEFASFNDMSLMSYIAPDDRTHIDETMMNDSCGLESFRVPRAPAATTPVKMPPPLVKTPVKNASSSPSPSEMKHLLNDLNLKEIKAAGTFLDGCGVFLWGWNCEEEDKLRRILKGSGAARFTELSDNVTHVLVGDMDAALSRKLKSAGLRPHVVSLNWLIQSITQHQPAAEELSSCFDVAPKPGVEPPSPLSKKGLALLQRGMESPVKIVPKQEKREVAENPSTLLLEYQDAEPISHAGDLSSLYFKSVGAALSDSAAMPPPPRPATAAIKTASSAANATGISHVNESSNSFINTSSQGDKVAVFEGLTFLLTLPENVVESYAKLIEEYGGEVVPKSFRGIPDYAIVPLQGATLHHTTNEIATTLWLDDCILRQTLLPIEYFHEPVAINQEKKPLKGCVLGISGFSGKEREFINLLAGHLGALVQEVFAKKDKAECKASTHLICTKEKSNKYLAAIKWGLPMVNPGWIIDCAAGSRVSERLYLVDPEQVITTLLISPEKKENDNTPVRPENPKVAALKGQSRSGQSSSPGTSRTPSTPSTPDIPLNHDPVLLQKLIDAPHPDNPFAVKTPNTPLGLERVKTREESKKWQRCLNRMPERELPTKASKRRDSTPLSELMMRIMKKTGHTPKDGGKDLEDSVGEPEIQQAAKRRKREDSGSGSSMAEVDSETPKIEKENCETPVPEVDRGISRKLLFSEVTESPIRSPLEGQIDELNRLIQTPESGPDRQVSNKGTVIASHNACNQNISEPSRKIDLHKSVLGKEASQPYAIKWEDPVNVNRVKEESLDSENSPSNSLPSPFGRKRRSENEPPTKCGPSVKTVQPVFLFSNVQEREECAKIAKDLGGRVVESSTLDPAVTHLVLDKPARSEKLLAAIASGKWILCSSYFQACAEEKGFVPEEDFEFGNPKNKSLEKLSQNPMEHRLGLAAYRWRRKLAGKEGQGAFSGMICTMYNTEEKKVAFARLFKSGGGVVLHESEKEHATICFVELNRSNEVNGHSDMDFEFYVKRNIPCVPFIYLNDYLTLDPSPLPFEKVVQPYARLLKKYKSDESGE